MTPLRLGILNLADAERRLIQAYLRIFAVDPAFPWRSTDVAPFDAVLVDGGAPMDPDDGDAGVHRIHVGSAGDGPWHLQRPLRSDRLEALLSAVKDEIKPAAKTSPSPLPVAKPVEPAPPAPTPAPLPPQAALASQPRPQAERPAVPGDTACFRLKRWPPASVLQRNPQRLKAATMMLRRHMSVRELCAAIGWSDADSRMFIAMLRNIGVLQASTTGEQRQAQVEQGAAAPRPAGLAESLKGVISIFRKKLGL